MAVNGCPSATLPQFGFIRSPRKASKRLLDTGFLAHEVLVFESLAHAHFISRLLRRGDVPHTARRGQEIVQCRDDLRTLAHRRGDTSGAEAGGNHHLLETNCPGVFAIGDVRSGSERSSDGTSVIM